MHHLEEVSVSLLKVVHEGNLLRYSRSDALLLGEQEPLGPDLRGKHFLLGESMGLKCIVVLWLHW